MSEVFLRFDQNLIRKASITSAEVKEMRPGKWYVRIKSLDSTRHFYSDPKSSKEEAVFLLNEIQKKLVGPKGI